MIDESRQLNPFEIKAEITALNEKLKGVQEFDDYLVHFRVLDSQEDKNIIIKLLFKELVNIKDNAPLIKFLLIRYTPKKDLIERLWNLIKNPMAVNLTKIVALDILRDIDTDWSYENCENYLENPDELIDNDTKKLLTDAIINPEVQIDFLDFLHSLSSEDKITLVKSLADDYSGDELANILIPIVLSQPDSEVGKKALDILSETKSILAYHALITAKDFLPESIQNKVKKAITTLKLAGIREDNSIDFYKNLLKNSKPYKFYTTYPDGHGNQALIFTRIKTEEKVQFIAVVMNDYLGIRDCFGFNEISKFECDTIINRFYKAETAINITPEIMKRILIYGEKISNKTNNWLIPYEYVCWKNLLSDVENDDKTIMQVINEHFQAKPVTKEIFDKIINLKFMDYWFLDNDYSDEFTLFIQNLNTQLSLNINFDIDKMINEELYNIFSKEEQQTWLNRLLMCSYLFSVQGFEDMGQNIYNLYFDEKYKTEFLKVILRKSIYEYYASLNQSNTGIFTKNVIEDIIKNIENKWVENV